MSWLDQSVSLEFLYEAVYIYRIVSQVLRLVFEIQDYLITNKMIIKLWTI
jgi:hypothetical protein